MESPNRRKFFGFGKKKQPDLLSEDESDYGSSPKTRNGRTVGFSKDAAQSEELEFKKKLNVKKANNMSRPRAHSDSDQDNQKAKGNPFKKIGDIFKPSRVDDGFDSVRQRKLIVSNSRDSDEQRLSSSREADDESSESDDSYEQERNDGRARVNFDFTAIQHCASFPGTSAGAYENGLLSTRSAPQLPGDFPSVNVSRAAMMNAQGERARYSVYHGGGGLTGAAPVKKKFRVRPYHCFDDPVHMTEEDIYKDSLKPSKNFEFLTTYIKPPTKVNRGLKVPASVEKMWGTPEKDGRLGSLRVEALGSIGLARTKPDICVYFVCADMAFCSDVISSYRSPMWPCTSRRAAVFPINHAYAQVYIGVFDCKKRKNKENDVFCGRIVLDIAAIRPETEYDVTFPLRHSSFIYDRRQRGVIRLRFALHWFNERAAITSYFKKPTSIVTSSPLIQGQPTIPCADPKTFRNVAVTCHGIDLPGKYTRSAFRATMRELNLYVMNIRQVAKVMILDAVLYERPLVSIYLFFAGMHCILSSSARLVPPYCVGFVLIQLLLNHQYFVGGDGYNLGYKPLTFWEIAKALLYRTDRDFPCLEPMYATKRTKERKSTEKVSLSKRDLKEDEEQVIEYDHREFPFSERDTYSKFSVEDSLAPGIASKGRRESMTRLHGRLSVYYSATTPMQSEAFTVDDDDDESSDDSEADDDTVIGEAMRGDTHMYGLGGDEPQDEDDELLRKAKENEVLLLAPKEGLFERDPHKKRLKVGPPQDTDIKGKTKTPPQVHLSKVETKLHKASFGLSVELIHPPLSYDQPQKTVANMGSSATKKQVMDDFDRLLGLNDRSANPIIRIASSFLGPLMRMIRIFLYLVRISFHVTTWRDPYLTFWIFIGLSLLCIILIMFPWRSLFSILTIALVGPQNLFVRVYLAKKASKKKREEEERTTKLKTEMEDAETLRRAPTVDYGYGDAVPVVSAPDERKFEMPKDPHKKAGFWQRRFGAREVKEEDEIEMKSDRPVFSSTAQGTVTRRAQPRSVAIPYSRFKKDRFFDWPPDPTVSRATPLIPWGRDTELSTTNVQDRSSEFLMKAASEKSPQRAELRRRIAAANRNQEYVSEN